MKKVCIVYASMTGNTENITDILTNTIGSQVEVNNYSMDITDVKEVLNYDYILLGSYTYDDGDIPYEAEDFYEQLDDIDLTGKYFACFGSGDSFYEHYCEAPVLFEAKVKKQGGTIMVPTLKIELSPDDKIQMEMCRRFGESILAYLSMNKQEGR